MDSNHSELDPYNRRGYTDLYRESQLHTYRVNRTYIYVSTVDTSLTSREYFWYLVKMFIDIVKENDLEANILINVPRTVQLKDKNKKNIRITLNTEHLQLLSNTMIPLWKFGINTGLIPPNHWYDSDIIIDYSASNIMFLKSLSQFQSLSNKHILISPSLYNKTIVKPVSKCNKIKTLCRNPNEDGRVGKLIKKLKSIYKNRYENVQKSFDLTGPDSLSEIYSETDILINLHRHESLRTCEELRILPAIQRGVLVISEDSLYRRTIPYNNLVIWSDSDGPTGALTSKACNSYDNLIPTIDRVSKNFEFYYRKTFTSDNTSIIDNLHPTNKITLKNRIFECLK